jgi:hypothetical protein
MTKPLTEPTQLVKGMSHKEMLEIMRSNDIFCGHDKFARILQDAQRRALADRDAREAKPFDAMEHQVLLGYDKSGDAVFGTDPEALAEYLSKEAASGD